MKYIGVNLSKYSIGTYMELQVSAKIVRTIKLKGLQSPILDFVYSYSKED